jgi:alkaline phosphatase D
MLGKPQLEWLIQGIRNSSAVWKFLASPLVMMQMLLDLRGFESLPPYLKKVFYFKLDQWDGYRTERKQLLSSIRGIENVVVLSGDLHGFYAGELYEDFDNPSEPVAVEFAVAGISSSPVREQVERIVESQRILKKDLAPLLPFFDANILQSNPHIRYASGTCYGVGIVEVKGREEIQVTFLRIEDVTDEAPTPQPSYISFRVERGKRIINPLAPEVQNR